MTVNASIKDIAEDLNANTLLNATYLFGIRIIFVTGALVLIGTGIIWYKWNDIKHFLDVDSCLDRGGAVSGAACELEPGKFVPLNCYGESCMSPQPHPGNSEITK